MTGFLARLFGKKDKGPGPECIVPRLKTQNFLAVLREQGCPADQMPVTEPFVADLLITYAFDLPNTFQMVSCADLKALGLDMRQLRAVAVGNLTKQIAGLRQEGARPLYSLAVGNDLEACLLLVDEVWRQLAPKVPGKVVVSVPARNVLLYTSSTSEDGLRLMRQAATEAYGANPVHGLTTQFLAWGDGRWELFGGDQGASSSHAGPSAAAAAAASPAQPVDIDGTYKINIELTARKQVNGLLATAKRLVGYTGVQNVPDPPDKEEHIQKVIAMFRQNQEAIDSVILNIQGTTITLRTSEGEMVSTVESREEKDSIHVVLVLRNEEQGKVTWNMTLCGNVFMFESEDELSEYVFEKQ